MDNNERLSLLGLFPEPDGETFDQADIQQILGLFRMPIAGEYVTPDLPEFIKRGFILENSRVEVSVGRETYYSVTTTPRTFRI